MLIYDKMKTKSGRSDLIILWVQIQQILASDSPQVAKHPIGKELRLINIQLCLSQITG